MVGARGEVLSGAVSRCVLASAGHLGRGPLPRQRAGQTPAHHPDRALPKRQEKDPERVFNVLWRLVRQVGFRVQSSCGRVQSIRQV